MVVIAADERQPVEIEGNLMRGLAVATTGAMEAEVWDGRMVRGASTPPHFHDAEEIVVVLEGSIDAEMEGSRNGVDAGEVLIVPAKTVHQLHNTAAGETRKIAVLGRVGARTYWPDGRLLETPWQD